MQAVSLVGTKAINESHRKTERRTKAPVFSLVFISQLCSSSSSTQTLSDKCMMGIGVAGAEWGVRGVAEKLTGRVTNGRQPGFQLTVAVLQGGLVNEKDR